MNAGDYVGTIQFTIYKNQRVTVAASKLFKELFSENIHQLVDKTNEGILKFVKAIIATANSLDIHSKGTKDVYKLETSDIRLVFKKAMEVLK